MQVNWRLIHAARNSFAVLSAACGKEGIPLTPVTAPAEDITCYSLNSINEHAYRAEIAGAGCTTIVGGPHATACPRKVAEYADFVITGEGEFTLPRLIREIGRGGSGQIPGVVTRDYGEPADTAVLIDAYPAFSETKGYVEISRGCPFACGYCQTPQIFGRCMRHRSMDAIARYANRYEHARFVSPNAFAYGSDGVHPRWAKVKHLLGALTGKIYFGTFPSEVRPEFVCEESLSLVSRYCANTRLHFGAQSGSDRVLRLLNRGHSIGDAMNAVDLCTGAGITPVVDFIVGFPFETDGDQEATLAAIAETARHGYVRVHRFLPLPGTPLAETTARPLRKETDRLLGKLALSGRLSGSWDDPEIRFFRRGLK